MLIYANIEILENEDGKYKNSCDTINFEAAGLKQRRCTEKDFAKMNNSALFFGFMHVLDLLATGQSITNLSQPKQGLNGFVSLSVTRAE